MKPDPACKVCYGKDKKRAPVLVDGECQPCIKARWNEFNAALRRDWPDERIIAALEAQFVRSEP